MHLRAGYADWSYRNVRSSGGVSQADGSHAAAARAPRMRFRTQWEVLERGLLDCTDPLHVDNAPCFDWKNAAHRSPTVQATLRTCYAEASRRGRETPGGMPREWALRTPANGTLASALGCAAVFGERLALRRSRRDGRASFAPRNETEWGLLVLGDAPALASLARGVPQLRARVVDTSALGPIGHTSFGQSCDGKAGGVARTARCTSSEAVDPSGAWTRAMVDFYLGGTSSSFVTVLFSSWGSAMLSRSLLCCRHRYHFGAMYSTTFSHRDKPMTNVDFLQALTQVETPGADPDEWGAAGS